MTSAIGFLTVYIFGVALLYGMYRFAGWLSGNTPEPAPELPAWNYHCDTLPGPETPHNPAPASVEAPQQPHPPAPAHPGETPATEPRENAQPAEAEPPASAPPQPPAPKSGRVRDQFGRYQENPPVRDAKGKFVPKKKKKKK